LEENMSAPKVKPEDLDLAESFIRKITPDAAVAEEVIAEFRERVKKPEEQYGDPEESPDWLMWVITLAASESDVRSGESDVMYRVDWKDTESFAGFVAEMAANWKCDVALSAEDDETTIEDLLETADAQLEPAGLGIWDWDTQEDSYCGWIGRLSDQAFFEQVVRKFGVGLSRGGVMVVDTPTPEDQADWYFRSAASGDADAELQLGWFYHKGEGGVAQDDGQAFQWMQRAAMQKNVEAQYMMGWFHEKGLGVAQNYEQAAQWYLKSAHRGDADAQFRLGLIYQFGKGVPEQHDQAALWYRKAAKQGNADAQYNLGYLYWKGLGVPQDDKQALQWYRKAAEQGDAEAQCQSGWFYEHGLGVPQDYEQAVQWYRKSAEQDDADAQCNLGYLYDKGLGVPQDYGQAVQWYRSAAASGHARAQNNLGNCYNHGTGVPQNKVAAYALFHLAAMQDHESGISNRSILAEDMTKQEIETGETLAQEMGVEGDFLTALDRYVKG
jgi:TPR repeat protein